MTFRPAFAAALAILAVSTVSASPAPMSAAKPGFDGAWSVLIVTEVEGGSDDGRKYVMAAGRTSAGR